MECYTLENINYHKAAFTLVHPQEDYDPTRELLFKKESLYYETFEQAGVLHWFRAATEKEVQSFFDNMKNILDKGF